MSLRISSPSSDDGGRRGMEAAVSTDYYLDRLVKLIPGEAVVVYPFLNSRAESVIFELNSKPGSLAGDQAADALPAVSPSALDVTGPAFNVSDHWLMISIAWLILLVVVLLRWQATRGDDGKAQWGAVAIAAVSFLLWVPVMNGSFGMFSMFELYSGLNVASPVEKFIPELLLVLWTILIPAFYRPQS
ncbi:MAG: hypothetical protein ABL894_09545 [Hyphomicrobium sp.]